MLSTTPSTSLLSSNYFKQKRQLCTKRQQLPLYKHGHWKKVSNQREFMNGLAKKLEIKEMGDWNKVTQAQITKNGGATLLRLHNMSTIKLLRAIYPEHNWEPTERKHVPSGFWHDLSNQRHFMDMLGKKLNIKEPQDWATIKAQQINENGGATLLRRYSGSVLKLLHALYPEHSWPAYVPSKSHKAGYWKDKAIQRKFMDDLGQKLDIKDWQDWNKITQKQIIALGGGSLLSHYKGSPMLLLQNVYPEHNWQISDRKAAPHWYWRDFVTQRSFMDELGKKLRIQCWQDWKSITRKQILDNGGAPLLYNSGSIKKLIESVYPEHNWQQATSWKSKSQHYLHTILKAIIPNIRSYSNFRHPDLVNEQENRRFELNIFFPTLSLSFEYQGEPNYFDFFNITNSKRRAYLNELKKGLTQRQGITLIPVPFWWDTTEDSLVATIRSIRPDIELTTSSTGGQSISIAIPPKIKEKIMKMKQKPS